MESQVYIGTAGFSYKDWDGVVYPSQKPSNFNNLTYLARYVDVIEINSTFYNPLRASVFRGWLNQLNNSPSVSDDFIFTVKLWQKFTHDDIVFNARDIDLFKNSLIPLFNSKKLGALLIQFPFSFQMNTENVSKLEIVLKNFQEFPRAVEIRHNSWDNDEFLDFLRAHKVAYVNIDQPHIGKSVGVTDYVTSEIGYVRLHGRNYQNWFKENVASSDRYNYLYTEGELETWVKIINKLSSEVKNLFVITNNHFKGKALVNALQLKFKLVNSPVRAPEQLVEAYPEIEKITEREVGQLSLF
ncbi:DUF72 domain-containing protein [bacterium]|nr:DUF72 domain-containing protein [bacterium]